MWKGTVGCGQDPFSMELKTVYLLFTVLFVCCSAASIPEAFEKAVPYEHLVGRPRARVVTSSQDQSRIVNGFEATENQFPYQALVLAPTNDGRYYVCGGSIISSEWILSAAHCTFPHDDLIIRVGSNQLWQGGYLRRAANIINHPFYNSTNLNNDVSLIRLAEPLDLLNTPLRAVLLPGLEFNQTSFIGSRSRVAGWGLNNSDIISEQLNFVDLEVIDNPTCSRTFGRDRVVEHVLCGTGWHSRDQATCGGDSGSALVTLQNGQWVQIGVAAFGALRACSRGFPSGFMRVTSFTNWITQVVQGEAFEQNPGY